MTTKQKLILFLISCDPGIKDTYTFVKLFDRVDFPAKIEENLKPLLDDQLIVPAKWYDGNYTQPLAYSITPKGKTFIDRNFNDKEILDYLNELPLPNRLLEITKIYIDKKSDFNTKYP
jgi:hypothetical protein